MELQIAFDTHAFVKRLTRAGMPETQAEIIDWGQAHSNEHLATQPDLKALELTLKNDLEIVKAELKHDLEEHKAANRQALKELELTLRNDYETLKAELKNDIKKVRAELETVKIELKRDIHAMEHKLTIKLGAIVVICITVLSALDKLL